MQPLWLVIVGQVTWSLGAVYYPDQVAGIDPAWRWARPPERVVARMSGHPRAAGDVLRFALGGPALTLVVVATLGGVFRAASDWL